MELLLVTASLPWGSGERISCWTLPGGSGQWNSFWSASLPWGSGLSHCHTAGKQWAVRLVWCGVVWCGVPKALLPKGKRPGCLPTGTGKRAGLCVLCARCA